jgi:pyridoxal phosphate enzyme (YggS family)
MIGGLQTNKCKPLASQVPNLWCVSSVDTAKKADELEKGRRALVERTSSLAEGEGEGEEKKKLRVLVQINTSHEASKSGVDPVTASAVEGDGGGGGEDAATALCRHIQEKCPHLRLAGLMTIGAIARSQASAAAENEDFVTLRETRDRVVAQLGLDQKEEAEEKLELSMGMSSDFEAAIGAGSDEVRVGTGIFGERPARKDATIM